MSIRSAEPRQAELRVPGGPCRVALNRHHVINCALASYKEITMSQVNKAKLKQKPASAAATAHDELPNEVLDKVQGGTVSDVTITKTNDPGGSLSKEGLIGKAPPSGG